ncbi:regulatory protein RecX [Robertkochia flava]|uniref:regulatory protein RecX n=1 Tax=Robertkochia flava TaxID=3447986 RepID=UPI001CCE5919|nr:regulatory protein RecX [Robertkochia marina]
MEHYCAYQERCHKEVISKLTAMKMIPLAIDTIVAHLIEHNFLNEERFAKEFARGKFRVKKWGRKRIERELKLREISRFNIRTAMEEIPENSYINTLHELASRRLESLREPNKLKAKKKLADYLLYRGWESHLVYEKINELID